MSNYIENKINNQKIIFSSFFYPKHYKSNYILFYFIKILCSIKYLLILNLYLYISIYIINKNKKSFNSNNISYILTFIKTDTEFFMQESNNLLKHNSIPIKDIKFDPDSIKNIWSYNYMEKIFIDFNLTFFKNQTLFFLYLFYFCLINCVSFFNNIFFNPFKNINIDLNYCKINDNLDIYCRKFGYTQYIYKLSIAENIINIFAIFIIGAFFCQYLLIILLIFLNLITFQKKIKDKTKSRIIISFDKNILFIGILILVSTMNKNNFQIVKLIIFSFFLISYKHVIWNNKDYHFLNKINFTSPNKIISGSFEFLEFRNINIYKNILNTPVSYVKNFNLIMKRDNIILLENSYKEIELICNIYHNIHENKFIQGDILLKTQNYEYNLRNYLQKEILYFPKYITQLPIDQILIKKKPSFLFIDECVINEKILNIIKQYKIGTAILSSKKEALQISKKY